VRVTTGRRQRSRTRRKIGTELLEKIRFFGFWEKATGTKKGFRETRLKKKKTNGEEGEREI